MKVFFYGLFMDQELLIKLGVTPSNAITGFVDGFELRIGERATLQHCPGAESHGVVMDIDPLEATKLYSGEGVADYIPETVMVNVIDGRVLEATCYNLPADKVTGTNKDYAEALLKVTSKLKLPQSYLDKIAHFT